MPTELLARKLCQLLQQNESWHGTSHIDAEDLTDVVIDGHYDLIAVAEALIKIARLGETA